MYAVINNQRLESLQTRYYRKKDAYRIEKQLWVLKSITIRKSVLKCCRVLYLQSKYVVMNTPFHRSSITARQKTANAEMYTNVAKLEYSCLNCRHILDAILNSKLAFDTNNI